MNDAPPTEQPRKDGFEQFLDRKFERAFFNLKFISLLAVIATMCGSIILFLLGSYHMWVSAASFLADQDIKVVELGMIQSLDTFLFALVMMIFSFGTYDLFISRLDPALDAGTRPNWLKFNNVDELKRILTNVIIVILVINFYETIVNANGRLEYTFLIIPVGIILLAAGLHLLHGHKPDAAQRRDAE